jgi:hypothetical protein
MIYIIYVCLKPIEVVGELVVMHTDGTNRLCQDTCVRYKANVLDKKMTLY